MSGGSTRMLEDLAEAVRQKRAILFVGAGVSMAVGLPSWHELIAQMGEDLELDPHDFVNSDQSYQTLAEFYRLKRGSIGPLRSWMDRKWSVSEDNVRGSQLHDLIVELDFPIIYTTNYDANLEVAYRLHQRDFVKVTTARDIASIRDGVPQIVRFHGDFDDDQSLVLAESDYFDRLSFDTPLDIKFRADALGRTILFIGYSMSDPNIRLLLYRLWQIWRKTGRERDRPPSYVFMPAANPVQEAVLGNWGVIALTGSEPDPQAGLTAFLTGLRDAVADA
jgi:hypothetical protein